MSRNVDKPLYTATLHREEAKCLGLNHWFHNRLMNLTKLTSENKLGPSEARWT